MRHGRLFFVNPGPHGYGWLSADQRGLGRLLIAGLAPPVPASAPSGRRKLPPVRLKFRAERRAAADSAPGGADPPLSGGGGFGWTVQGLAAGDFWAGPDGGHHGIRAQPPVLFRRSGQRAVRRLEVGPDEPAELLELRGCQG